MPGPSFHRQRRLVRAIAALALAFTAAGAGAQRPAAVGAAPRSPNVGHPELDPSRSAAVKRGGVRDVAEAGRPRVVPECIEPLRVRRATGALFGAAAGAGFGYTVLGFAGALLGPFGNPDRTGARGAALGFVLGTVLGLAGAPDIPGCAADPDR
jgi:hypothetical protein